MSVYIGDVPTFKHVSLDKPQALKVLEESSEVVDAFKAYYETFQTDWTEPDNVTDCQMARQHLLDECADVIQATSNLLSAVGEEDMTETLARCKAKNERRGYEYADDRECITDSGKLSDSREQLEADVRSTWGTEQVRNIVLELLDRQAAITEREAFMRGRASLDDELSEYQTIIEATKRAIAKAGGTWTEDDDGTVAVVFVPDMDKLKAERNVWRNAAGNAHEAWEEAVSERDKWRDKFGKALDFAHEIARLQE